MLMRSIMNTYGSSEFFKEEELQKVLELLPDPVAIHSEGKIVYVNAACLKLIEANNKEEIIGKPVLSFVHNNYKEFVLERIKSIKQGIVLKDLVEEIFITLSGKPIYVEVAATPIIFKEKDSVLVVFKDITKKKLEEQKLLHRQSLLKSIHSIDQKILQGKNKDVLLKEICEDLKKVKEYGFAWIGRFDNKVLIPFVGCGEGEEFPNKIKNKKLKMPEILVLKRRKTICGKIPFKYDEFKEWNDLCKEFGFLSFCFIPITIRKSIWGVLSSYTYNAEFFDREEKTYLQEIASEIGIALYSMELKEEEKKAKKELAISEEKIKALLSALDDVVFSFDKKGRFTFYHSKAENCKHFIGKSFKKILPFDFSFKMEKAFKEVLLGKSSEFEYWTKVKDKTIWYSIRLSPLYFKNKIKGVVGVSRDITDRIIMEAEKINAFYKIQSTLEATVKALANAVELRDATTFGHQGRTAKLACAIAQKLGLANERIEGLRLAAYVHDVGKIGIPAEILAKPGQLLPIEIELIKTHAQMGFDILKGIEFPWPVHIIVLQHSEHIDGSGYPQGLKGDEMLEESKILAVADAIDAMCSHRPYRPALSLEEVIKQIEALSGKWYDKKVVEAAINLIKSGFVWF